MARQHAGITTATHPTFTDVFKATDVGGSDGLGCQQILLTNRGSNNLRVRCEDPLDTAGEYAELLPTETKRYRGKGDDGRIKWIKAAGVGAAGNCAVEVEKN